MDYLITNPSKKVFIRLDNNGRPETCGRETAQKFESSKAKNIVDHLPKTLKRFHFRAQAIPEITPQVNKNIVQEMEKNIIQGNVDYEVTENITQWLDKFGSCADVLNEAKERQKSLLQQLEDTDNKLLDILHKEMIACMCEAHSGEWNKNRSGEEIMPEPRNDMEFFIHECDILSSRADLDMIIPNELKDILSGEKTEDKEVSLEEYRIDFGKHSGRTLLEIRDIDPGYIRWMKENMTREPVRTLLMQI